jgi:hypothetical protein
MHRALALAALAAIGLCTAIATLMLVPRPATREVASDAAPAAAREPSGRFSWTPDRVQRALANSGLPARVERDSGILNDLPGDLGCPINFANEVSGLVTTVDVPGAAVQLDAVVFASEAAALGCGAYLADRASAQIFIGVTGSTLVLSQLEFGLTAWTSRVEHALERSQDGPATTAAQ